MRKVGSRELKNRLGRYLRMVKRGETLVITERNRPVAHLVSTGTRSRGLASLEETLQRLSAAGILRLATKRLRRIVPVAVKGKAASRIILEDRR